VPATAASWRESWICWRVPLVMVEQAMVDLGAVDEGKAPRKIGR
jgi:hypothetical protein